MRVQHQVTLTVSDDAAAQLGEFSRSSAIPAVVLDGFTASASGSIYLPATGAPVTLSLGDVGTGCGFYLEVDGPAQLTINGGVPITVQPGEPTGVVAKVMAEVAVTGLTLASATTGTVVRGSYTVWGQQPPVGA